MRPLLFTAIVASAALAAPAAHADKKPKKKSPAAIVFERFQNLLVQPSDDLKPGRFAFSLYGPMVDPAPADGGGDFEFGVWDDKLTVGFSANGEAAWVAVDLALAGLCGDESCYGKKQKPSGYDHATALFEGGAPWQPVMWHVARLYAGKDYAAAVRDADGFLDPVAPRVKGAEEAVQLFRATIADPKALARTVSPRPDVVLYGTDRKERYVGGKKVAATLAKWSLALAVKDGVQAGVTASGTVAWIAANVDATSTKQPGAKASPYRLTAIYEKTEAGWQIVNLQFSFP